MGTAAEIVAAAGQEAQRVPAFELRWRVALFLERRREHARAQLR